MNDQAAALRAMVAATSAVVPAPAEPPRVPAWVLGSGKGGVGKSVLSILLASALARSGRRTLLVDGAQNLGNLHIMLGLRPAAKLSDLHAGIVRPEALLTAVTRNLWLLPAESGAEAIHGLTVTDRARLYHRLTTLYDRYDHVIVDAGGGIEEVVRAVAIAATRLLVLAVPEPAALSDAYALTKIVTLQVPSVPVDVVVNRVSDSEEALGVHERLRLAASRFLKRDVGFAGAVEEDASMRAALQDPSTLLRHEPPGLTDLLARLEQSTTRGHHHAAAHR
ncbi:MAG: AAA family ATPase [Gemmatimonadales bacterium]